MNKQLFIQCGKNIENIELTVGCVFHHLVDVSLVKTQNKYH